LDDVEGQYCNSNCRLIGCSASYLVTAEHLVDTETQSTGNAAGASSAFADRKFYE